MCRHWAAALASGAVERIELTKKDPPEMWGWLLRPELAPTTLRISSSLQTGESFRALLAHCVKHATVSAKDRAWRAECVAGKRQ